jgi:hypothetical protein
MKHLFSLQFLNLRQSVGLLGWGISQSQGHYLHRTTQTQNKRRQTFKASVGFEPTIQVFERAKTFHALYLRHAYSSTVGLDPILPFVAEQLQKPQAHISSCGETKVKRSLEYITALLVQTGLHFLTFVWKYLGADCICRSKSRVIVHWSYSLHKQDAILYGSKSRNHIIEI